jgi:hypothetical protein
MTQQKITKDGKLTIPLFHGTSTIFLESIIENGLGGRNPIKDLNLFELANEVYTLSEKYLKDTELYEVSYGSFELMIKQNTGTALSMNFQHGDTYVTPSQKTAVRYVMGDKETRPEHKQQEYGSEFLTYTLWFMMEIIKKNISEVEDNLIKRFPKVYNLLKSTPSPIIVEMKEIPIDHLLSEDGKDPDKTLKQIQSFFDKDMPELCQQSNFRLKQPVPTSELKFWMINDQQYVKETDTFKLFRIMTG